jgi:hypothetical protein
MQTRVMKDTWTKEEVQDNRRAFVALLRSGELRQGRGQLYNRIDDSYCVIGALCKLFGDTFRYTCGGLPQSDFASNENGSFAPKNVIRAVGLSANLLVDYAGKKTFLWRLNDEPTNILSFADFANIIEEQPFEYDESKLRL